MGCQHEDFAVEARIGRLSDEEGGDVHSFVCELTVECVGCGERFGFRGMPPGYRPTGPSRSVDAREASLPLLSPTELAMMGPLPGMQEDPPPPDPTGFTIQVRGDL